jgi:hypothetical protein
MTRMTLLGFALLLLPPPAWADKASGNGALALSALVAANSPLLTADDKKVMAQMLEGDLSFSFPAGKKLSITADSIACTAGDVNIAMHECQLVFGGQTVSLTGRAAHELFATLVEAGVSPEGSAGHIHETLTNLACTVDPNEVKQQDGGGADCKF